MTYDTAVVKRALKLRGTPFTVAMFIFSNRYLQPANFENMCGEINSNLVGTLFVNVAMFDILIDCHLNALIKGQPAAFWKQIFVVLELRDFDYNALIKQQPLGRGRF